MERVIKYPIFLFVMHFYPSFFRPFLRCNLSITLVLYNNDFNSLVAITPTGIRTTITALPRSFELLIQYQHSYDW